MDKDVKKRTLQQNKALHKMFTQIAEQLNDAGLDMRKTLREGVDIPWKPESVKEYIWRPIQRAAVQKESTTELTTKEIDEVFEVLNRYMGEKHGVVVTFPSIEEIINQQRVNE